MRGDFIFSIAISHCCKTSPLARMSNENYFHCNTSSLAFTIARLLGFSLQELFVGSNESRITIERLSTVLHSLTGFMCDHKVSCGT